MSGTKGNGPDTANYRPAKKHATASFYAELHADLGWQDSYLPTHLIEAAQQATELADAEKFLEQIGGARHDL